MGKTKPPSVPPSRRTKSFDPLSSSELQLGSSVYSEVVAKVLEPPLSSGAPLLLLDVQMPRVETSSPPTFDLVPTPVKVDFPAVPEVLSSQLVSQSVDPAPISPSEKVVDAATPEVQTSGKQDSDSWSNLFKSPSKKLEKKGDSFTLPSGEACVLIPNSVIEKNRKSWDFFILGQFYSDPPSQGTIHNIVNSIWSRQYRDVTVSKLEGNAFLFRIPNSFTRNRVLTQRLWQIEGQTMFVAKWEPSVVPIKSELTSAPVWLELRQVPFQFFNDDGLERIASMVGHPKFLHPSTTNKTNLEVAKVLTLIGPRKPLPEAVNVKFESGQITRVLVSSPWMPPVCDFCNDVCYNLRRCKKAPPMCSNCNSVSHTMEKCSTHKPGPSKQQSRRHKAKLRDKHAAETSTVPSSLLQDKPGVPALAPILKEIVPGRLSATLKQKQKVSSSEKEHVINSLSSGVEEDSSDISSDDPQAESEESSDHQGYTVIPNKKKKKKKSSRGKGPKPT
ncbi:hypothetical protein AALP_AA5G215000 [Arabis alpina]|uniref:DUF4283 domain-containing protein n=1 Tax=Arabis alpina TaxID=50452 RepID=A0A087GYJ7_ARAAL|nr:hypothetical protein AALP_AA5G215000 [Arabis alpina]